LDGVRREEADGVDGAGLKVGCHGILFVMDCLHFTNACGNLPFLLQNPRRAFPSVSMNDYELTWMRPGFDLDLVYTRPGAAIAAAKFLKKGLQTWRTAGGHSS
jgi:hypothetical protein